MSHRSAATGLQASVAALVGAAERLRDILSHEEYLAVLDIAGRWIEGERRRAQRAARCLRVVR